MGKELLLSERFSAAGESEHSRLSPRLSATSKVNTEIIFAHRVKVGTGPLLCPGLRPFPFSGLSLVMFYVQRLQNSLADTVLI